MAPPSVGGASRCTRTNLHGRTLPCVAQAGTSTHRNCAGLGDIHWLHRHCKGSGACLVLAQPARTGRRTREEQARGEQLAARCMQAPLLLLCRRPCCCKRRLPAPAARGRGSSGAQARDIRGWRGWQASPKVCSNALPHILLHPRREACRQGSSGTTVEPSWRLFVPCPAAQQAPASRRSSSTASTSGSRGSDGSSASSSSSLPSPTRPAPPHRTLHRDRAVDEPGCQLHLVGLAQCHVSSQHAGQPLLHFRRVSLRILQQFKGVPGGGRRCHGGQHRRL